MRSPWPCVAVPSGKYAITEAMTASENAGIAYKLTAAPPVKSLLAPEHENIPVNSPNMYYPQHGQGYNDKDNESKADFSLLS